MTSLVADHALSSSAYFLRPSRVIGEGSAVVGDAVETEGERVWMSQAPPRLTGIP